MQVNELRAEIAAGKVSGIYLFGGEEDFLKRHYLREMRRVLLTEPAFDAFNHAVFEGESIDFAALLGAVEAPPMMAEHKLIEWHLGDFRDMSESALADLRELAAAVQGSAETVIVFVADSDRFDPGTLPKRPSKMYTALSEMLRIVLFEKSGDAALTGWILRHFAHEGLAADANVAAALLARSGHSMDTLAGEIDKLSAYLHAKGRTAVTAADIADVCAPNSEDDAFGLSNALLDGRADAAFACLCDMKQRKVDPTLALGAVMRVWSDLYLVAAMCEEGLSQNDIAARLKMHAYKTGLYIRAAKKQGRARLSEMLALCRRTDLQAKSRAIDGYLLLEFLLAETLCGGREAT